MSPPRQALLTRRTIRPELEYIGNVNGNRSWIRFDIFPGPVWHLDLKSSDGLSKQESKAAKVGMPVTINAAIFLILLWRPSAVDP